MRVNCWVRLALLPVVRAESAGGLQRPPGALRRRRQPRGECPQEAVEVYGLANARRPRSPSMQHFGGGGRQPLPRECSQRNLDKLVGEFSSWWILASTAFSRRSPPLRH